MNVNAKLEGFGVYNNREKMAPAFKLAATTGAKIASWDYKQRQPLVLYFLPWLDEAFLQQLEQEAANLQPYGAKVLVLLPLSLEDLNEVTRRLKLTVPLLADKSGETFQKYLKLILPEDNEDNKESLEIKEFSALVFVADRFGAISRYASASQPTGLPGQPEILATLEFLGNLCNP
jgi:peroxiredoxin